MIVWLYEHVIFSEQTKHAHLSSDNKTRTHCEYVVVKYIMNQLKSGYIEFAMA